MNEKDDASHSDDQEPKHVVLTSSPEEIVVDQSSSYLEEELDQEKVASCDALDYIEVDWKVKLKNRGFENFEEHFFTKDDSVLAAQQANRANAEAKGMTAFAKSYVDNVAVEPYWELYTSWCEIVMLQNYLLENDIPFRFMYVDDSLFSCNVPMDATLTTLRASIHSDWFINNEGMFNWAKRTEQPFYTTHPHESAHVEWINMLYDRIV